MTGLSKLRRGTGATGQRRLWAGHVYADLDGSAGPSGTAASLVQAFSNIQACRIELDSFAGAATCPALC